MINDQNFAIVMTELNQRDMLVPQENGNYILTDRAARIMNRVMEAPGMQDAWDNLIADGCDEKLARLVLLLSCAESAFCGYPDAAVAPDATPIPEYAMSASDYSELSYELQAQGYYMDSNPFDAEVAEKSRCEGCGSSVHAIGYTKMVRDGSNVARRQSYRCFIICDGCGCAYEI